MTISCPHCQTVLFDVSPSAGELVKAEQDRPILQPIVPVDDSSVTQGSDDRVNTPGDVEASGAQARAGDTLTAADKVQVRDLHLKGISAARIRQQLGLKVPIGQIYSVIRAKKP